MDKNFQMTENEMQLWTDKTFSQFAIFFNSQFIVKTAENVSYTNKIDETSYVKGYDINWHYINGSFIIFQTNILHKSRARLTSLEHLSLKLTTN